MVYSLSRKVSVVGWGSAILKGDGKLAPAEFNAWLNVDNMVRREDGAIVRKYRELIAAACAPEEPQHMAPRALKF